MHQLDDFLHLVSTLLTAEIKTTTEDLCARHYAKTMHALFQLFVYMPINQVSL